jgi:hypothetical protein
MRTKRRKNEILQKRVEKSWVEVSERKPAESRGLVP